ncbi:MAG: hydroxylamine oxidoreductase [Deltaproteobacteria bacterium]|nr:hydroxylamine oxidoreductase [Deltaproteobacteria bacterium]
MVCTRSALVLSLAVFAAPALAAPPRPPARSATRTAARLSAGSRACVECHTGLTAGIVEHWRGSRHAEKGVGCLECHQASKAAADAWEHGGAWVHTVVTPRDCARCHATEAKEFGASHHAKAGNILASLDNYLAETVEGAREPFDPHARTPGRDLPARVNGLASAQQGCQQCHGGRVALQARSGGPVTVEDLRPGADGLPGDAGAAARVARNADGRPLLVDATWPNTGIGRLNLDGSLGSCAACHSRHDFSARRARQPENCGKCHLGPDHPQKEIYEESKHGVAYRDLKDQLALDGRTWVLGKDYSAAPTCATCHMSANANGGKVTHDPGERISWTNRPPVSLPMDTDAAHRVVTEADPERRRALVADTALAKRARMQQVCTTCHAPSYVDGFYRQYDDFVQLYNEKFARPGLQIMNVLHEQGLVDKGKFRDEIEWTWFYLWHHEGRRARHGAAMMAPDYAHWHGMYEVAEDFYMKLVPQARELAHAAEVRGEKAKAEAVRAVVDRILARPEHAWQAKERPAGR